MVIDVSVNLAAEFFSKPIILNNFDVLNSLAT